MQWLAAQAHQAFGAEIWFAEILGKRWSYVAGMGSKTAFADTIRKIPLTHDLGLVCATWGTMTLAQQAAFIGLIKRQTPWCHPEANP